MSNVGSAPKSGALERALCGNIFIDQNLVFMNEGDKDSYNCFKHDIANVLRARTDDPASSVTNTSKKKAFNRPLTVVETFETFNPADYHNYWLEWQPDGNFQWEELPAEVKAGLEELFVGGAAEEAEDQLTNGDGTLVTGVVTQLRSSGLTTLDGAKATPTQVTDNTHISFRAHGGGTGDNEGVALTTDNIFAKMQLLINYRTKAMRKRPNQKFMISSKAGDLLKDAQRTKLNFKGVDIFDDGVMKYAGFEVVVNPSFPDNDILLCSMSGNMKTDAIQMGTSLSSDLNNLAVDRLNNFNRQYGMLLTFALDIFLVRPEECCYYTDFTIV